MSSVSGFSGVYAVDWVQTAPGEEWGLAPELMTVGMTWRWAGQARRLDAQVDMLRLDSPVGRPDPRSRARRRLRRLALAAMPEGDRLAGDPAGALAERGPTGEGMVLTDGQRLYQARVVRLGSRILAVFDPLLPPPNRDLWVAALTIDPPAQPRRAGVICFLPGTQIATPDGPRLVESLMPGDRVDTRDNGAQPLVWRGETRLSGAELYLHPGLRPIRVRAGALGPGRPEPDLLVSPGHRLLLGVAAGLSDERELLVSAADLEDGGRIRRDFTLSSVRYIHLMFEGHEIITANGLPCESFHPAMADPQVLSWHARSLEKAAPGLVAHPERMGAPARRCLDRGEAAILRPALV